MNKDVIYIDVDDDVTAIIGKIKKAKEKIVAVVPPKRTGTLQSAVNLRLLDRMARADKKQLVLITNNAALIALAANASIPVAKNLQTKPEIAEIAAIVVDDSDDIIDGANLPIGDHAGTIKIKDGTKPVSGGARSDAIDSIDLDNDGMTDDSAVVSAATYGVSRTVKKSSRGKVKIPNFDTFRKRLFLSIGGGVLLTALLVWMFVFAPAATIVVTAATSPSPISASVKLGGTAATDYKTGVVKSVAQTEKKDEVISFEATGTSTTGTKSTGTVAFRNCEDSVAISIPAGTKISANGDNYTTDSAVSVPGGSGGFGGCATPGVSQPVGITAADFGDAYDTPSGTSFSVSGHPNSATVYMRASATSAIAGGTSREIKVPTQHDIDQATGQLIGKSTEAQKKSLIKKFTNGEKVIDSSFTVDRAPAVSVPAVNTEAASGKATLTIPTTYTIYAIASAELESYLNSSLNALIANKSNQKVYDNGIKNAGLSNFTNEEGVMTVTITAKAQIGPKIDEAQIKDTVKGKIYGEVQSTLQKIDGIKDVDVKFSYFWVRTVPNNTDKITIQFQVQNE